jgi:formate-dependent nitrite reductase membrane component NrfD
MTTVVLPVLFVLGAIIVPCVAVAGLGFWLSRRTARASPESTMLKKITRTGMILAACQVLMFLVVLAARQLAQDSLLGASLRAPFHILLAFVAVWLFFTIASIVAALLGYPSFRRRARDT